ncbi:anti-sigma factor [Oceanimonas smirnovii]|uniref:anti-sigma factor n=1 Tax=Oceanimonas smirnovii TaxID=264574 RepID=UPI003FD596F5
MSNQEQHDAVMYALAGEYVLGTLSAEERQQLEQRLQTDERLQHVVAQWEERLHPLAALAEPVAPSSLLWPRIRRSIDMLESLRPAVPKRRWWQHILLWQGVSMAACALVTVLLLFQPAPQPAYVVVLIAPEQQTPGWLVRASNRREVQLLPLAVTSIPANRVLQFWTKGADWPAPVSLGLVEPGQPLHTTLDELPPLAPNQLFELTLEQPGGSPTGLPTGPVQFIGRAVAL